MIDGRVPRLAALVREALAVLAAILVAFALDAWWDGRVERGDMLEALDAVATEVDRNLTVLDTTLAINGRQAALVGEALQLGAEGLAGLTDEEAVRFAELPSYDLATLELGAVTAFIEGGFLATLEDRDLRAELAGLPRLQIELDEEAEIVASASDRLTSVTMAAIPIDELRAAAGPMSPGSSRAVLRTFTGNEDALRALLVRTFFLTDLYAAEVRVTRDRLAGVSDRIAAYRGEG